MASFPVVTADEIGWIDADAMREIDRAMVEDLGIALVQMMENAGRSLADLVKERYRPSTVVVLAGSGGNGGGGLVAARHLTNVGVEVQVLLTSSTPRLDDVTAHQLRIVRALGVSVAEHLPARPPDVFVDAMVGYSLTGPLRGRAGATADAIVEAAPIVSLDTPSGTDVSTGAVTESGVVAETTLTLCAPKQGLRRAPTVGELYVADISVPPTLVEAAGRGPAPPFERGRVLRVSP